MTDTPTIRTHTTTVETDDFDQFIPVPYDWETGLPVLVVAGLPEGATIKRLCDVPEGWEWQSGTGEWNPYHECFGRSLWDGLVVCRPVPVPAPPATERVPWREAIDRIAPASSYGPEKLLDHPAAIDYRMEDGMVEVLVEAPTGDDEPAVCDYRSDRLPALVCVRKAGHDGSHTWDQASADAWDDEPQADTPTPEGRYVVGGGPAGKRFLYWEHPGGSTESILRGALPDGAYDALVELVRRDGTAPTQGEAWEWLIRNRPHASGSQWPIVDVLAAVRALRDGATR